MAYNFVTKNRTIIVFLSEELVAGWIIFSFQRWSQVLAVTYLETVDGVATVFRLLCRNAESDYQLRHACLCVVPCVCLSVRMEHLGSHWTDFHEIWYWTICW